MSDTANSVANALYKIGGYADVGLACGNTDLHASTQITGDGVARFWHRTWG